MREAAAELFIDVGAIHGEGPTWDAVAQQLLWVDMHGRRVHRTNAAGVDRFTDYPERPAVVVPRRGGGFAIAFEHEVWLEEPDGRRERLVRVETHERAHLNDGKCDALGRLWVGSMAADGAEPVAALYRVDPDGSASTILSGVTISNGLTWTPDETTMYYIDSPTGRIDAFDLDGPAGLITGRRPVVTIPRGAGQPDGMTIDDDGCLWVAMWGGGAVHRYTPTGRLDTILTIPAPQVTSCAFGGSRLEDLFITTSTLGPPRQPGPMPEGAVYRWTPGVTGPGAFAFGG